MVYNADSMKQPPGTNHIENRYGCFVNSEGKVVLPLGRRWRGRGAERGRNEWYCLELGLEGGMFGRVDGIELKWKCAMFDGGGFWSVLRFEGQGVTRERA